MNDYGERLKQRRKDAGMTWRELGDAVGVSERLLRSFEKGEIDPTDDTRQRIDEALDAAGE